MQAADAVAGMLWRLVVLGKKLPIRLARLTLHRVPAQCWLLTTKLHPGQTCADQLNQRTFTPVKNDLLVLMVYKVPLRGTVVSGFGVVQFEFEQACSAQLVAVAVQILFVLHTGV